MTLDMRLTGTKVEIDYTLASLKACGHKWTSNNKYYPQRNETNKFAYYINDVTAPPIMPAPAQPIAPGLSEPQPGPYDAVLGGKQKQ